MITISDFYQGHKILLNNPGSGIRGKSYYAKNFEELLNAIKHYFLKKHNQNKCPLCKDN